MDSERQDLQHLLMSVAAQVVSICDKRTTARYGLRAARVAEALHPGPERCYDLTRVDGDECRLSVTTETGGAFIWQMSSAPRLRVQSRESELTALRAWFDRHRDAISSESATRIESAIADWATIDSRDDHTIRERERSRNSRRRMGPRKFFHRSDQHADIHGHTIRV